MTSIAVAQGLEAGVRGAYLRLSLAFSNRAAHPDRASLRGRPHRVLFVLEDAIGDTLLAFPAVRAMAESHPDTTVDVATWGGPAELLRGASFVRDVIVFPRHDHRRVDAWRTIRQHGPYDVVVDGMVLRGHVRTRTIAMMLASGARYWVGEGGRGNDFMLNVVAPTATADELHLWRTLALVEPFLSVAPDPRPKLELTDGERVGAETEWSEVAGTPRILINVSTGGTEREWPAERLCETARHIRRRRPGAGIVVVGMDRDMETMSKVASAAFGKVLRLGLRELVAMVAASDLVVSPDTAVCHIASAFERPLISIHSLDFPAFRPYETPGEQVIGQSPVSLEDVSVEQVSSAVDRFFAVA